MAVRDTEDGTERRTEFPGHIYSQQEGRMLPAGQGQDLESKPAGPGGGGLCSTKNVGCPRFLQEDVVGLFLGWEGLETQHSRISRNCTWSLGKEDCLVGGPYLRKQRGRGACGQPV